MQSGPNVFVSYAEEDAAVCAPLLEALAAWGVAPPAAAAPARAGVITPETQAAIAACDIFLRLCTYRTAQSYAMSLESGAFLSLQAEEQRAKSDRHRALINVILDPSYKPTPFDASSVLLDAARLPPAAWTAQLRTALGLPPLAPLEATTLAQAIKERVAAEADAHRGELTRRRLLRAGAGGLVLVAAGAAGVVWYSRRPQPLANHNVPLETPAAGSDVLWTFGTGAEVDATPVLLGTTLYVGSTDGYLYALDTAHGGKQLWSFNAGDPIYSQPAVAGNVLYLDDHSGPFFAIDATSGKQIWPAPAKGSALGYIPSAVANGRIYTEASSQLEIDLIRVIDARTGQDVPIQYIPEQAMVAGPRVVGDLVYTVGSDVNTNVCTVYALRTGDAQPAWTAPIGNVIRSNPAYGAGRIFVGSMDHHVYAFDAQTGAPAWKADIGDQTACPPTFADGVVYIGNESGVLYALDAATGAARWRFDTGGHGSLQSTPLVTGGRIYFGSSDHHVYAVDLTGTLLAKYLTNGTVHGSPAVAGNVLYVSSRDRFVYAFRLGA